MNISRLPISTIPINQLPCSLTATNINKIEPSPKNNTHKNTVHTSSQSTSHPFNHTQTIAQISRFQTLSLPSTKINSNPYSKTTYTQPVTNIHKKPPNTSDTTTYLTMPSSTKPFPTISNPTYINFSASISEIIKSFDGLDQIYKLGEYLQHFEARVTLSSGTQPTTDHEFKFWHGGRMVFIQCSLSGRILVATFV